jgi:hypothetical protein
MKTTLVMKDWSGQFARAAMPGEAPSTYHSNLQYRKAGKVMVSHGFGKAKQETEPEGIWIRTNVFRPKGGKFERVRKLPQDVVDTLEAIDAAREVLQRQLQELSQKERKLLAEVFDKCSQLKMTEVRGFKNV